MKITFLGTGTSQGVPVIGGTNRGLDLSNPKNWRTRTSAYIELSSCSILVDASPELRIQCLKNGIDFADIFILTHGHADHIAGMDDLRRFCDKIDGNVLPVYSNDYGLERIRAMFPYALDQHPHSKGYPCFAVNKMPETLELPNGATVKSVELPHGPVKTLGLVFEDCGKKLAYFTDCKNAFVPRDRACKKRRPARHRRPAPAGAPSHLSVEEAIEYTREISPKVSYFIHTTGRLDYGEWEPNLPAPCHMAYLTGCPSKFRVEQKPLQRFYKDNMKNKTAAIVLSGCGVFDGSEIHEAVITLLNLQKLGAKTAFFGADHSAVGYRKPRGRLARKRRAQRACGVS